LIRSDEIDESAVRDVLQLHAQVPHGHAARLVDARSLVDQG
jgi:hypothetical protein